VAPLPPDASAVTLDGVPLIVGAVVSRTVTVNGLLDVLPALSVALHVTVVAPRANVLPDAGVQETASLPSALSVAVGFV
jgi:hypothetical protein